MNTIKQFDAKSLVVALSMIAKSAVATRDKIQEVAAWACATSIINGDVSVGNALFETMGSSKSLRKDSLAAYLEEYGNFAWRKETKKFDFFLNKKTGCADGTLTPEGEARITGTHWYEAKKEADVVSEYDMEKQLRVFIAKCEKQALEPANTILNRDVLFAVTNAFNRIVAEKTLRTMVTDNTVIDATTAQQAAFKAKQRAAKKAAKAEAVTVEPQLQAVNS